MLLLIFFSGCFHNRVTVNPLNGKPGETKEIRGHFFLTGLVPVQRYSAKDLCADKGIYQVHSYSSFLDLLLSSITLCLYTPKTLEVICNDSRTAYRFEKITENTEEFYTVYSTNPDAVKNIQGFIPVAGDK